MKNNTALLVIDMQNDFCNGGALEVPGSKSLIRPLNIFVEFAEKKDFLIIFTRDWHPSDHCSFRMNGGDWPQHCIKDTIGAQFHPDLYIPQNLITISKGTDNKSNGYSAFENDDLLALFEDKSILNILIAGLATDYCVKETALGAMNAGLEEVILLDDLCRSITRDSNSVINDLLQSGIIIRESTEFLNS